MNHTLAQRRALTLYRATLDAQAEARRVARHAAIRERLVRKLLVDRAGWLFAASVMGAALAVAILKAST